MLPQKEPPLHLQAIGRWIRRVGPGRSLAAALGLLTLVLLGCYTLTEHRPWWSAPDRDLPPKITVSRMARVRLLGRKPQRDVKLAITSPFDLAPFTRRDQARNRPKSLPTCTVRPAPDGGINLGGERLSYDDILITPRRDASIVVNGKTYRGLLRIHRVQDGISLTNHVDIESYLLGVLRGELPRNFHPESFKAQCVAARTYVLYQMRNRTSDNTFDVFDHEGSQMYIGVQGEDARAVDAVEKTRGQVCIWNNNGRDELFCTYYSSTCGGRSQHVNNVKPRDPDVPPLHGDVPCRDCYLAKFYRWAPVRLSKSEVTNRVVARYPKLERLGTVVGLRPKGLTPDGRIIRIQLDGSTGLNDTLVGEDFRLSVGGRRLKSTNFTIENKADHFVFRDGKGFGHGVGLCQYGMETKARRGMKYRQILAYYYPGSKIKSLYDFSTAGS